MADKDEPDKAAGKAPQVKSGVKEDTPHDSEADKTAAPDSPLDLARKLRAKAAAIEFAAVPEGEFVRLKVEPPYSSFTYGGVEVGSDWTPVHVSLAPGVLRAAVGTPGVTVTQEEG